MKQILFGILLLCGCGAGNSNDQDFESKVTIRSENTLQAQPKPPSTTQPRPRRATTAPKPNIARGPGGGRGSRARAGAKPTDNMRRTYLVGANDTLWGIATAMYGRGKYWQLIAEANPNMNPAQLKIGAILIIPPIPAPEGR